VLYVLYGTYGRFYVLSYILSGNKGKNGHRKSSLVQSVKIYTAGSTKIILR